VHSELHSKEDDSDFVDFAEYRFFAIGKLAGYITIFDLAKGILYRISLPGTIKKWDDNLAITDPLGKVIDMYSYCFPRIFKANLQMRKIRVFRGISHSDIIAFLFGYGEHRGWAFEELNPEEVARLIRQLTMEEITEEGIESRPFLVKEDVIWKN